MRLQWTNATSTTVLGNKAMVQNDVIEVDDDDGNRILAGVAFFKAGQTHVPLALHQGGNFNVLHRSPRN